jgi:hypothetical protein
LNTGTSIIAKNPEQFGLTLVPTLDAHSTRAVAFRVDSNTGKRTALVEEADASFDEAGGVFPASLGRPWAGGTDTLHSMIYNQKYGRLFFKESMSEAEITDGETISPETLASGPITVCGMLVETPFNLGNIIKNRNALADYVANRLQMPAEPTYAGFTKWAATVQAEVPNSKTYWLTTGAKAVQLDKLTYKILKLSGTKQIPISELLSVIPENTASRMLAYLLDLEKQGFLLFAARPNSKMRMVHQENRRISGLLESLPYAFHP